jgi:predicted ribonuclease toxin of YeeF-YezG toxin-antitoxin module
MFTREEYDRGDAIAISWHIDDVKGLDDSLTDDQAREILSNFEQNHDGSMQAMWEDLQLHIDWFKEGK